MSIAEQAGDDPIHPENIIDDIETRLADVTDGVFAITHMTRDTFNHPVEADGARLGIHYVALKLEGDLREMRELISTAWRARSDASPAL